MAVLASIPKAQAAAAAVPASAMGFAAAAAPRNPECANTSSFHHTVCSRPFCPKNQLALLAPSGQKSMPTGPKTSSAVQAVAPTTLRRSRSITAASSGPC